MRRTVLKLTLAAAFAVLASGCATGMKHEQMAASMPNGINQRSDFMATI